MINVSFAVLSLSKSINRFHNFNIFILVIINTLNHPVFTHKKFRIALLWTVSVLAIYLKSHAELPYVIIGRTQELYDVVK